MNTESNSITASAEKVVTIIVPVTIKNGQAEKFENAFKTASVFARTEEGSLGFQLFKVLNKENQYVVKESYKSETALHLHMEKGYTVTLLAILDEVLATPLMDNLLFSEEFSPAETVNALV